MNPMHRSVALATGGKTIANRLSDRNEDLHMAESVVISSDTVLPPDVDAMRRRLLDVQEEVTRIRRVTDGMFFGTVGLDGLIGVIPFVGCAYSVYGGIVLLIQAIKAKCSLRTILMGIMMVTIDVVIGILPVAGDIADMLFRSHAWFAGMILNEVEAKLAYIARIEDSLAATSSADGQRQVQQVRDHLFRGGKSEATVNLRLVFVVAACLFLVHECRRAQDARQETIRACEERGGWFCSVRH